MNLPEHGPSSGPTKAVQGRVGSPESLPAKRVKLLRAKQRISRILSSRSVGLAVGAATRHHVRNQGVVFDTTGWDPRVEAMLAFRIYESAEIRFIRKYLCGTGTAIELGGSLGVTGSYLLGVMEGSGSLTSVEANAELIPTLEKTLYAHARGRKVVVMHAAVADRDRALLAVGQSNLSSHLAREGVPTPGLSLAAVVSLAGYGNYHLLSDIEGAEATFILGGPGLETCTRMVIELHDTVHGGRPVSVSDLLLALLRGGFRLPDRYRNVCALAR